MQPFIFINGDILVDAKLHTGSSDLNLVPRAFVKLYEHTLPWQGISSEQFDILHHGPSHAHYVYTWNQVLHNAFFVIDDQTFYIRSVDNGDICVFTKMA